MFQDLPFADHVNFYKFGFPISHSTAFVFPISQGPSHRHGHGPWLVCELALSFWNIKTINFMYYDSTMM